MTCDGLEEVLQHLMGNVLTQHKALHHGMVIVETCINALDALVGLDGTDELATRARAVTDRIYDSLPDEVMRRCFTESEVVLRIRAPH